jgi:hypothetical protein
MIFDLIAEMGLVARYCIEFGNTVPGGPGC